MSENAQASCNNVVQTWRNEGGGDGKRAVQVYTGKIKIAKGKIKCGCQDGEKQYNVSHFTTCFTDGRGMQHQGKFQAVEIRCLRGVRGKRMKILTNKARRKFCS